MSKIKVTFVETNCKKNGPIKQTLNIIRNMDKEVFEPSLVTVWPEDADNSMIDEYKKLGIPVPVCKHEQEKVCSLWKERGWTTFRAVAAGYCAGCRYAAVQNDARL